MAKPRRQPKRSNPIVRLFWTLFKIGFWLAFLGGLMGAVALAVVYQKVAQGLPDVALLADYDAPQTTRILASDGTVVATLFEENRTTASLDQISPHLVHALLATEDSRFYQHRGVDWIGVARAAVANLVYGEIDQGASTITMQLARNRFLSKDQTFSRKLREAILAERIEEKYPKSKILELYLNNVYFGSGAYGVGAASSLYFNRACSELSPAQAAMLAGLLQAPSSLSPLVNPEGAIKRTRLVLGRMHDLKYLNDQEYQKALDDLKAMKFGEGEVRSSADQMLKYPYFTSYVIAELAHRYPEELLYRGGLTISTTLDVRLQRIAEEELAAIIAERGPEVNATNAACVLVENKTGYVRAMVGGTRWSTNNQFNRAWQAIRQPGSSFKPLVYAAALEGGMTPETIVADKPVDFGGWAPKNSDGTFMGEIPLRTGLQYSRNVISARVLEQVGTGPVIALAQKMGIHETLTTDLSLALGASEVAPLSMATAYGCLASGGLYRYPHVVTLVEDPSGEVLTDNRQSESVRVLQEDTAAAMTEMMTRVVTSGTATAAAIPGVSIAGKTGTTDESRDAWFVGFTPDYTLAVWVGNDDHSEMYAVFGGGIPAVLWRNIMTRICDLIPPAPEFPLLTRHEPRKVKLCKTSTMLASKGCKATYTDVFRTRYWPETPCTLHGGEKLDEDGATPEATETPTPDESASPVPEEETPEVPDDEETFEEPPGPPTTAPGPPRATPAGPEPLLTPVAPLTPLPMPTGIEE